MVSHGVFLLIVKYVLNDVFIVLRIKGLSEETKIFTKEVFSQNI